MSSTKRFIEDVSQEMGLKGEITEDVLDEAQRRLDEISDEIPMPMESIVAVVSSAQDKLDAKFAETKTTDQDTLCCLLQRFGIKFTSQASTLRSGPLRDLVGSYITKKL